MDSLVLGPERMLVLSLLILFARQASMGKTRAVPVRKQVQSAVRQSDFFTKFLFLIVRWHRVVNGWVDQRYGGVSLADFAFNDCSATVRRV